jgi:hypothetical protein
MNDHLTPEQLDGLACVCCNDNARPMVPIDGVESQQSTQLFRCECCECDPAKLQDLVLASELDAR